MPLVGGGAGGEEVEAACGVVDGQDEEPLQNVLPEYDDSVVIRGEPASAEPREPFVQLPRPVSDHGGVDAGEGGSEVELLRAWAREILPDRWYALEIASGMTRDCAKLSLTTSRKVCQANRHHSAQTL